MTFAFSLFLYILYIHRMKIIVINHRQASPKPRILLGHKILIACCGAVSADTNTVASL